MGRAQAGSQEHSFGSGLRFLGWGGWCVRMILAGSDGAGLGRQGMNGLLYAAPLWASLELVWGLERAKADGL